MSFETQINNLIVALGTDWKEFNSRVGLLANLSTTDKTSIVNAINEIASASGTANASDTVAGIVELATVLETTTGTDATRAVTPAGLQAVRVALKDEILGAGVPAALDTLDELAAALGDDANFASTVTTALANRVRVDTAAQGLTGTQKQNARTNIDVYSTAEIGNVNADFVAAYTAAKA
jgi:hypothetical protein